MMDEHQNRLTTIRMILAAHLFAAAERGMTHRERNHSLEKIIDMIVTWQQMDIDQANQMTELSEDEVPF